MFKRTFEVSGTPCIVISECLGDLTVRAGEAPRITVRLADGADAAILSQQADTLTLAARDDCTITCPRGTALTVDTVRGDLRVCGVHGPLAVKRVHGDILLRDVGSIALGRAYGDLTARVLEGDLEVKMVAGDVRVREVKGRAVLQEVGSDLQAEGLQQGLEAPRVGADVRLAPPFAPGATYHVRTGSDALIHLPPDASLRLVLRAGGRVRSTVPDMEWQETADGTTTILGSGEATLDIEAGGDILLQAQEAAPGEPAFAFVADLEGLGLEIEARIHEAMAEMEARLEESLRQIDSEALRRRVERAAEQARRAAERAAERARMRAERAERRWRRASGRPSPHREPPSDEERLRVLRLLEQGKITTDQAAELLAALEGR